jgi:hypothetical protein
MTQTRQDIQDEGAGSEQGRHKDREVDEFEMCNRLHSWAAGKQAA